MQQLYNIVQNIVQQVLHNLATMQHMCNILCNICATTHCAVKILECEAFGSAAVWPQLLSEPNQMKKRSVTIMIVIILIIKVC